MQELRGGFDRRRLFADRREGLETRGKCVPRGPFAQNCANRLAAPTRRSLREPTLGFGTGGAMPSATMFSIRIHGRGGQGVVTAAELLSVAAFLEGKHAQAFPSFGPERSGAPVVAFCRIDDGPIRSHEPVTTPDAVVVVDASVMHVADVLQGLGPRGFLLVNAARAAGTLGLKRADITVATVPATEIARRHLGRPLPNIPMLGALAALAGTLKLASIIEAVRQRFPGRVGEANAAAATEAFNHICPQSVGSAGTEAISC
jgi:pyruvate ferredoxin oxidoreductase gamma subunit